MSYSEPQQPGIPMPLKPTDVLLKVCASTVMTSSVAEPELSADSKSDASADDFANRNLSAISNYQELTVTLSFSSISRGH